MPSQGSITKTIRLSAEDRAVIERIMEEENVTWSGAIHRLIVGDVSGKERKEAKGVPQVKEDEGVPKIMSEETYKDLENMCRLSGFTLARFMDKVRELFNNGDIYVDGLTIRTRGEYDLSYLIDVCHRANVDPQEMINKLANNLVRR